MPTPTQLRRALASQNLPCPACHYNLRGNESLICPECGTPVTARPAPSDAAWRLGLAGMLATYACLGAIVALAVSRTVSGPASLPAHLIPATLAALFLSTARTRITRWRRTRRALGHQPPHLRQQRAAAWWAAAALAGLLLLALSRPH